MKTPAEFLANVKGWKKNTFKTAKGVPAHLTCRLLELRIKLGLSQQDVAKSTGVSGATICRAEHGMEVGLDTAFRLAKFFGKPIEQIWSRKT